jgi:hypothetical protein
MTIQTTHHIMNSRLSYINVMMHEMLYENIIPQTWNSRAT